VSFCWLGDELPLKDILIKLGHSRQSLKKSEVAKKTLERLIRSRDEVSLPASLLNRGEIYPRYSPHHDKPEILEEAHDILALSKPSGIHCHPLHYGENDNLLSFLREKKYFDYLKVNQNKMDRGLLYRLDYETSGLILLTKNESLLEKARLGTFFKKKIYHALVEGEYKGPRELHHHLSTSGKVVKEDAKGKEAHLKILQVEYQLESNMSLLEVELKEGLRHQIRVQLALTGYPIVGDELYGGQASNLFGLHCFRYEVEGAQFKDDSFLKKV
jgi:23S rRNA pseudouridine1911/1915/1917 synthase